MFLCTLKLHNYRMFKDVELEFDPKYSVIIGVNGAGKTTILEAATIALGTLFQQLSGVNKYGFKRTDAHRKYFPVGSGTDVQPQYPVENYAEGVVNHQKIKWKRTLRSETGTTTFGEAKEMTSISTEYQKRLQAGDDTLTLPILAYYGTGRLWDYHREKQNDITQYNTRTNGYIDCMDGTANSKLMMNWFQKMTIQKYQRLENGLPEAPELHAVYKAMEECLADFTGYRDIKIQYNMDTLDLDVLYTDEENRRIIIPLGMLSDGFKEIISVVADIAYRMAVLNPQLLDKVILETDGVVLIDEVDLHLHPAWQQKIMGVLTKVFPKVQFIVTTHAPAVVSSVDRQHMILLKNGEVKSAPSQTHGKDINSVLEEIMGVNSRPPEFSKLFSQFYNQLKDKQYDNAQITLDRLSEMREYHDPEIAQCRVKLKLERIRGDQK